MSNSALNTQEPRTVRRAVLTLTAQPWGIAFGLLFGLVLFMATMILVMKGGENVGEHPGLSANYFSGYRVTTDGAFLDFIYSFVICYIFGRLVGVIYNSVTGLLDARGCRP